MSSFGYIKNAVTALAGGGQAANPPSAAQLMSAIVPSQSFTQISVCATANDSVTLPLAIPSGMNYTIRNDGVCTCSIYPPLAGQINALGINTAMILSPGSINQFTSSPNSALTAGGIQYFSENITSYLNTPTTIAIATAVAASPNATAVYYVSQAAAYTITLPAVATNAGSRYKFIVTVIAANTVVIDTAAAASLGSGTITRVGAAGLLATNNRQINILTGAAVIGDYYDVWCDGVKYYAYGFTTAVAGATFS